MAGLKEYYISPQVLRALQFFEREQQIWFLAAITELPKRPYGTRIKRLEPTHGIPNGVLIKGDNFLMVYAVEGAKYTAVWLAMLA